MTERPNRHVQIFVSPKIEIDRKAKRINFSYSVVNMGSVFSKPPQIRSIEATLGNQSFVYQAMSDREQAEAISRLESENSTPGILADKKRLGRNKPIEGNATDKSFAGYLPYRLGLKPVGFRLYPVALLGRKSSKPTSDSKIQEDLAKFSNLKSTAFERLTKRSYSNALISGVRDKNTGAVVLPTIRFRTEEGAINLKVNFRDGTFSQTKSIVEFAPDKVDIESEYVAGDGHVHTDYSWYMPTVHIANGPSVDDRIREGYDNGLKWMFFTDYSLQFFSQYSRGGIRHVGNAQTDPATGKPYRTAVWDDHVEECLVGLEELQINETAMGNLLVVASQEVPSNIDSHNLVWASMNPIQKVWERPERLRSEQFDARIFSIYNLLKFILGSYYLSKAFSHDQPWQDKDIRMDPYCGYEKAPYAYFEHDLVWGNGILRKPFVVAAHPYNSSYKYKGLHLAMTGNGWKPMAVSHAHGSSLVGFEIFEDPINPAKIAKHDVLAVWNIFLWHEMPATFAVGKFLVAYANSDAHLSYFSGQNKFGKTRTYLRMPDFDSIPEEMLFESVLSALEAGHCTCSSTGDFGTFVLKHKGKTYHPGDFAHISDGDKLEFEIYGRPSSADRIFAGGNICPCTNPSLQAFDTDASTPEKDTDYLEAVYQIMTVYAVGSSTPDAEKSTCSIEKGNQSYPGTSIGKTSIRMPFGTVISAFRAEVVFRDGSIDGDIASVVYTNPIFVSFKDKP